MTREECDQIVGYIAAIYGLRATDATRDAWHDQFEDLQAEPVMAAVRTVMREQDSRSWPLISHIRARAVAETHPGGISPVVRRVDACGRCRNGLVVLSESRHDLPGLYEFVYRCRCPAGAARPERYPGVPDWAIEEAPPDRKSQAADPVCVKTTVRQVVAEVAQARTMPGRSITEDDLDVPF